MPLLLFLLWHLTFYLYSIFPTYNCIYVHWFYLLFIFCLSQVSIRNHDGRNNIFYPSTCTQSLVQSRYSKTFAEWIWKVMDSHVSDWMKAFHMSPTISRLYLHTSWSKRHCPMLCQYTCTPVSPTTLPLSRQRLQILELTSKSSRNHLLALCN